MKFLKPIFSFLILSSIIRCSNPPQEVAPTRLTEKEESGADEFTLYEELSAQMDSLLDQVQHQRDTQRYYSDRPSRDSISDVINSLFSQMDSIRALYPDFGSPTVNEQPVSEEVRPSDWAVHRAKGITIGHPDSWSVTTDNVTGVTLLRAPADDPNQNAELQILPGFFTVQGSQQPDWDKSLQDQVKKEIEEEIIDSRTLEDVFIVEYVQVKDGITSMVQDHFVLKGKKIDRLSYVASESEYKLHLKTIQTMVATYISIGI